MGRATTIRELCRKIDAAEALAKDADGYLADIRAIYEECAAEADKAKLKYNTLVEDLEGWLR